MIKSALRYPGGKSRLVDTISNIAPKDFKSYREPFLGGGSVFLRIVQDYPGRKYWINDLYYDLYCFWVACRNDIVGLHNRVCELKAKWEGDGRGLHKYLVENIGDMPLIDKAAAFFVLNRITFSGTILSGGFSNGAYEKRFTDSSIARMVDMSSLLKGVDITNEDFAVVLAGGNGDTFTFLDPPYYSATDSALYGKNGELHKGFDHERLAAELQHCKHRWLMTYDDCEYIRELYKDFNIKEFELMYGMRNVSKNADMKGKEIFISNYSF